MKKKFQDIATDLMSSICCNCKDELLELSPWEITYDRNLMETGVPSWPSLGEVPGNRGYLCQKCAESILLPSKMTHQERYDYIAAIAMEIYNQSRDSEFRFALLAIYNLADDDPIIQHPSLRDDLEKYAHGIWDIKADIAAVCGNLYSKIFRKDNDKNE